jgi:hypothetical protein
MVMHGNFSPRFRPPRDKMPVGGPLLWDGDDPANPDPVAAIRVVTVSVRQDASGASAAGNPDAEWRRPGDDDVTTLRTDGWYADLDVKGKFLAGKSARAHADVVVTRDDSSTAETVWDHDIMII